jgi:hypothetical protein
MDCSIKPFKDFVAWSDMGCMGCDTEVNEYDFSTTVSQHKNILQSISERPT